MRPMTIDDLRTHLDALFGAFNDHDAEAILAMCTEDVVWEDPSLPTPAVGWYAVADLLATQFTAFPDLHFPKEEIEIYRPLDGRTAAAGWHMVGTMTGRLDPPGYWPTGMTGDVTGMTRYSFDGDGLITHVRTVYDTMSFEHRLGLIPGSDNYQFRALAGLHHAEQVGRDFVRKLHH